MRHRLQQIAVDCTRSVTRPLCGYRNLTALLFEACYAPPLLVCACCVAHGVAILVASTFELFP